MAERHKLLEGRGLSQVQVEATYYCEVRDQVDQRDRDQQTFKYTLLQTGHWSFQDLFPELAAFVKDEIEDDDSAPIDTPGEGETIVYKFTDATLTQEEVERELAQLMSSSGGMSIRGGDMYGS